MKFVPATDDRETWRCIGWVPNLVDKRNDYEIVQMSPRAFLRMVDPSFRPGASAYNAPSIKYLAKRIRAGACFAPLQAWPNRSPEARGVMQHEGRHRALLAARLGMKTVPVAMWRR